MSRRNSSQLPACRSRSRKLRIEHLEERRLLATVTVSNNLDMVNGDTATIDALINNDGGDGISIREAIEATNNSPGADELNFDFGHDGPETILLTTGELRIFQALTISGAAPGAITIDAQQQSRIMRIDNFNTSVDNFAVTLSGLTMTGGHTLTAGGTGGAILAANLYLFINDSIIEGNYTSGSTAWGGAIFSEGYVTVSNSTFRDNYTTGNNAVGGAIFARGDVTLNDSNITNNHTTGASANAGGLRSNGKVVLLRSTVSGNWTEGDEASGGGIEAVGDIILTQSTVSGNATFGDGSFGGGMFTFHGVDLTHSTISGNRTSGSNAAGGGIRVSRQVSITQSTITDNWTELSGVTGGGLYQTNYSNNFPVTITGTIIAGNRAGGGDADLKTDPQSTKTVDYSLIGVTTGSGITAITGIGNLLDVNPTLGPLADNGGPTMTHALLAGSPAIDAGDPGAVAGMLTVPLYDQRGVPYARVFDGDGAGGLRIDIGAYEFIPSAALPTLFGDYNQNGTIDEDDYTVWRDALGTGATPFTGADGSGNGTIGPEDYDIWKSHYGETLPMGAGSRATQQGAGSEEQGASAVEALAADGGVARPERLAMGVVGAVFDAHATPFAEPQSVPPSRAIHPRQDAAAMYRSLRTVRHDDALLAWLSSRSSVARGRYDGNSEWRADDRPANESDAGLLESVDVVFQMVGSG